MKFKNIKRTVATALAIATIGTTAAAVQNAVANPLYAVTSTTSFADLPSSHWAYKYVMEAAEKGWVSGTGNGQYNPTGTVSGWCHNMVDNSNFLPKKNMFIKVPITAI